MNKDIKAQNSYSNSLVHLIFAHISKFAVDFNLIMMSKPKYIVIFTGLFCSVVASSSSHFYSFFPLMCWQGFIFGMTT